MSHLDRVKGRGNLPLVDASRTMIPLRVRIALMRMKMTIPIVEMIEILKVNVDCKYLVKVIVLHAPEILAAGMDQILDPARTALATFG